MPIDWLLFGIWAGARLLGAYEKEQEEEKRRQNIVHGVCWSISDAFGSTPGRVLDHLRQILTGELGWNLLNASADALDLFRGNFHLRAIPAEHDLSWKDVPVDLTLRFSRASVSATRVKVTFSAPSALEFTRECSKWFHNCASKEWRAIFDCGRQCCPLWVKVGWNGRLNCPAGWLDVRAVLRSFLCNGLHWSLERSDSSVDAFRRGEPSKFAACSSERVKWIEIPNTLDVVAANDTSAGQSFLFRFLSDESITFDTDLKAFFLLSAKRELDSVLERLNDFYRRTGPETEDNRASDPPDGGEDEEEEEEEEEEPDDGLEPHLRAALKTLGLTDAATWREVQAAYRRLAKKFHPDTHSSRRPTSQQVKNLEREFCRATEAYNRLRDFFRD